MKILFTGGSSFTGCWFVRELALAGHEVTATFTKPPESYPDALRRERVSQVLQHAQGAFDCSFGDPGFMELLRSNSWDLLCHHAAEVTDYKSEDFDVAAAVANNTHNIADVMNTLARQNTPTPAVVLTGSVFENDEGAGSEDLPAFSPYGLSKGLTYKVFREHAQNTGLRLGKFVIPNPFGPLEEPRFTAYLMRNWFAGKTPAVNTPDYVRDNIHVSLLALAYRDYAERVATLPTWDKASERLNPSGYVETQGDFAQRFAAAMRDRLGLACELELNKQTEFAEPRERFNTDTVDGAALGWDESAAWDEVAEYYRATLQS